MPRVPGLAFQMPYGFQEVEQLAEGPTTVWWSPEHRGPRHVREGCVVKPLVERTVPELGRVALKLVGLEYLSLKQ